MWRIKGILQLLTAAIAVAGLIAFGLPAVARASQANEPSLVISQLKITSHDGQFITLYNSTDHQLDMGQYQLEYFNNYDPGKATSSRVVSLSGLVPPHGYFMANSGSLVLCYQVTIDSLSLGFSSTAGMIKLLNTGSDNTTAPILEDFVGWSKTDATGAQTLPADNDGFLQRQPVNTQNNPLISEPGDGGWQVVQPGADGCSLVSYGGSAVIAGNNQLLPPVEPSAIILSLSDGYDSSPGLPAPDSGLMAPMITELLPNPAGSGNDETDEFVELYNPNNTDFDLGGFTLQTGTTSLHNYKFPAGTGLMSNGFRTFYSADTSLSLSNGGGRARLLDPAGNLIAETEIYGVAKDGLAWVLANGKWYWTSRPTPGAANIIDQPSLTNTKKTTPKNASKQRAAATAKTTKAAKTKTIKPKKTKTKKAKVALPAKPVADKQPVASIHPWTLALVGVAAILYGTYEYRADLTNRIHRLRSYFRARREGRT